MSKDEFIKEWRGKLFAMIFEAEAAGLRSARQRLLDESEKILGSIFDEMTVPPGPVPAKIIEKCRDLLNAIKELLPKELVPIVEKLKNEIPKMIPFDAPGK